MEVYSEVTMAKDALKKQAAEIAVAAEEMGLELAKELQSNLEKWLMDKPGPQQVDAGGPAGQAGHAHGRAAQGTGGHGRRADGRAGGPVRGDGGCQRQLDRLARQRRRLGCDGRPHRQHERQGRDRQRSCPTTTRWAAAPAKGAAARCQGEMVEDTASGKGGRHTPTRLDPTPFQQGQIKDEIARTPSAAPPAAASSPARAARASKAPSPPSMQDEYCKRLAAEAGRAAQQRRAPQSPVSARPLRQLQDAANRSRLMRRVESDLKANRYQNALRRRDVLLDDLDDQPPAARRPQVHVQHDTSPTMSKKTRGPDQRRHEGPAPRRLVRGAEGILPQAFSAIIRVLLDSRARPPRALRLPIQSPGCTSGASTARESTRIRITPRPRRIEPRQPFVCALRR